MPRRVTLSIQQNEILRILREAGEETLGTVLNTLRVGPDANSSVSGTFVAALEGLLQLGFVAWEPEQVSSPIARAQYDRSASQWTSPVDEISQQPVSLVMTQAGQECLSR